MTGGPAGERKSEDDQRPELLLGECHYAVFLAAYRILDWTRESLLPSYNDIVKGYHKSTPQTLCSYLHNSLLGLRAGHYISESGSTDEGWR